MKDLNKRIEEMSGNEMETLILQLSDSDFWPAILKYLYDRANLTETALISIDPFKEPTEMARSQGRREGLYDLPQYVDILVQKEKEAEAEGKEKK